MTDVETPPPEAPAEPYVDPYRMVMSPYELPANPVAAQQFVDRNPGVVDPAVEISEDRQAQAEAAIQAQQESIDGAVASIPQHPAATGPEQAVKEVEAKAEAQPAQHASKQAAKNG